MTRKLEGFIMKYVATISLDVLEIEADNEEQAEKMINQLIDELATVETSLPWDGVWWTTTPTEVTQ
jgi:hypothetical protein